jgi:hypothetical protein
MRRTLVTALSMAGLNANLTENCEFSTMSKPKNNQKEKPRVSHTG